MIKNNATISGGDLSLLTFSSKEKVIKICDICKSEREVSWNTVVRCRKKHNTSKDYCYKCAIIEYNTGSNNVSKKIDVRNKISLSTKGKSKSFKDGKNHRILNRKISSSGQILLWLDEEHKYVQEHRIVFAKENNKHHSELNTIHHINGNKIDNSYHNLIELSNSDHMKLHHQLESLAFELINKNFILFDKNKKQYFLSPQLEISCIDESLGFENITIKQRKNICDSRLDVNIESEIIRGIKKKIPMIASNMSTVTNSKFCILLDKLGAMGILHRANTEEFIINEVKIMALECEHVAASIGIGNNQFELAKKLIKNGCNIITIDIAHGYSDAVLKLGRKIKKYESNCKVIIGNTTNTDIINESYDFVDAIKVGIASGLACETKNTAGCFEKQFSAVLKFKHIASNFGIPIISDGGIREPADFTKAIAAGANSIMAGSIFAACPESAADQVLFNGENKKIYAGMASEYVQEKWKGGLKTGTCAEGGIRMLDLGISAEKLLERYSGALKSGITYSGANDIISFQNNVKFIKI